jgi:hypothetical protein
MMMQIASWLLAEAVVTHGTQGEVSTVTTGAISAVVGAICTVLVMYFRTKAKVTVDGEVNLKDSATKPRKQEVSWTEVRDLKDRMTHMERKMDEMKVSQGDQFQKLLTAAFEREHRLMEKIEKSIAPVHNRIDEMLRMLAAGKQNKQ